MSSRSVQKRLALESLETRQLLAADGLHNFLQPLDVNDDQRVTAIDALAIINHINRQALRAGESPQVEVSRFLDVSDDGQVEPIDALRVINHLNRAAEQTVDRVFAQLANADGTRMRAELAREAARETATDELIGERFEVRLQHGVPGREYPVFVDGGLVGNVRADAAGRGVFRLLAEQVDELPLLEDIAARIQGNVRGGGLIHVEGLGGVLLGDDSSAEPVTPAPGDGDVVRIPDFGMLPSLDQISGPVFAAPLQDAAASYAGGAYFATLETGFSLGLVARGLSPGETYRVAVDGVEVLEVTAGRFGVAAMLYDSTNPTAEALLNPLPEVADDSEILLSGGNVELVGTFRNLRIPGLERPDAGEQPDAGDLPGLGERLADTLVAPLDDGGVAGLVTYTPRGDGYYLGIALRGAERRASYEVRIDGQSIATVRSNFLGLIIYRQTSNDAAGDGFPAVTEDSVVEIVGLASGDFLTVQEGISDLLGR
ncbi:dockerin type I domain-containing protein [Planctomycetaceae bacterium SH139]